MQWIAELFLFQISGLVITTKFWYEYYRVVHVEISFEAKSKSTYSGFLRQFFSKTRGFAFLHLIIFAFRCSSLIPSKLFDSEGLFQVSITFDFCYLLAALIVAIQVGLSLLDPKRKETKHLEMTILYALVGPIFVLNLTFFIAKIFIYVGQFPA